MQKIPSLIVNGEIDKLHDWIFTEKAVATQMYDGKSYAIIKGNPYVHAVTQEMSDDFIMLGTHDAHFWGWEPVDSSDSLFWPMWKDKYDYNNFDWSYEVVGPGIGGNPEQAPFCVMIPHGTLIIPALTPYWGWKLRPGHDGPEMITVESIKRYLASRDCEGVVWWEDKEDWGCRKVKVQQSDFGFARRREKRDRY